MLLTFRDINTNDAIANAVIRVGINGSDTDKYIDEEGVFSLYLDPGKYELIVKVNDPATEGKDYFKTQEIIVDKSFIDAIYLFSVGSLRGIVKDTFENVVPYAELRFECSNEIGIDFPEKTTKFGSFVVEYIPAGSCKVFAYFNDVVGIQEIEIEHGKVYDAEIILDTSLLISKKINWMMGVVALIVIVLLFLIFLRKKNKKEEKIKKEEKKEVKGQRAQDILKTLNNREKKVIEYLLESGKEETQAHVRHNTEIPRTSLARCLQSLEAKNIIQIKKIGKLVKIRLTGWFMEQE